MAFLALIFRPANPAIAVDNWLAGEFDVLVSRPTPPSVPSSPSVFQRFNIHTGRSADHTRGPAPTDQKNGDRARLSVITTPFRACRMAAPSDELALHHHGHD
jgi:hypothetical protein